MLPYDPASEEGIDMQSRMLRGFAGSALLVAFVTPAMAAPLPATTGTMRNVVALALNGTRVSAPMVSINTVGGGQTRISAVDGGLGGGGALLGLFAFLGTGFFIYEAHRHDHHHHIGGNPVSA